MLEEKIDTLVGRVEHLELGQQKTNGLLAEILAELRQGGNPSAPAPVAANTDEKPVKSELKAKPAAKEKSKPKAEEPQPVTLEDIKRIFLDVQDVHGKVVARGVVTDTVGEIKNINDLPEGKFSEVFAALEAKKLKEAA